MKKTPFIKIFITYNPPIYNWIRAPPCTKKNQQPTPTIRLLTTPSPALALTGRPARNGMRCVHSKGPQQTSPWKINMEHTHGGLEDHFPF